MIQWLDDLRWGWRMIKARRARRRMYFSERETFDNWLRPHLDQGKVLAYPSAFYYVEAKDIRRALTPIKIGMV